MAIAGQRAGQLARRGEGLPCVAAENDETISLPRILPQMIRIRIADGGQTLVVELGEPQVERRQLGQGIQLPQAMTLDGVCRKVQAFLGWLD